MIIKQDFLPRGCKARSGILLSAYKSITIHWIGPYPNQSVNDVRQWWEKGPDGNGIEASAHYIIKDDMCLQAIPLGEVAWHCGSKGNYESIGIEVIPMNMMGEFSMDSIESLKHVLAYLDKVPLVRHYDWTKKDCPQWYTCKSGLAGGDERWEALVKELTGEVAD